MEGWKDFEDGGRGARGRKTRRQTDAAANTDVGDEHVLSATPRPFSSPPHRRLSNPTSLVDQEPPPAIGQHPISITRFQYSGDRQRSTLCTLLYIGTYTQRLVQDILAYLIPEASI